ncbi:hypothetical protein D8B26_000853 [Coccidioides posadasii str. Silveira]|uniref:Uncharacterized protein n=3 Tax=Coccidioides posadasii TaxID=199306 RepID=E9CRP1_COCPS|nr:hypothetical protein CPC735_038060 [Coccidioides posadasii C735 delta SOWgp]EER29100.1 hypothetical protein CPC735_038060 [Coccidioides posadasii C735 delta SOWgp]EFW22468.1 hypothetical protein CPSG_00367 [Coccidioides posadasii str. Silveira]KMM63926.1 hypothetical protein CPAG_00279 [Coccidioides posadasii RMSCC 3488]QVM06140.1 hypothetical protein D8B26_000853 [Coccidioides posadasii str. Silveira]|eukprot:XP_003071245.1 hypothetical protein CPC735_038060 [Coccidioides posadasii C735 delta SOWgp]
MDGSKDHLRERYLTPSALRSGIGIAVRNERSSVVEDVSIRGRGEEAKKSIHSICDYIDYMSPEPLAACALPASNREYPELLTLRGHGNQRSSRAIALWMLIHLIQCLTLPSAAI